MSDATSAPEVAEAVQRLAQHLTTTTDDTLNWAAELLRDCLDLAERTGQPVPFGLLVDRPDAVAGPGQLRALAELVAAEQDRRLVAGGATERPAEPGEVCTCGRPAVTVFLVGRYGPVGYCGRSDGGERSGPCPFCGGARHRPPASRCPEYRLRPAASQPTGAEVSR
jgi:hypothetical protein